MLPKVTSYILPKFVLIYCTCSEHGDEFLNRVGGLFRLNHWLLNALGVGHPSLASVFEASSRASFACKLTGAGGGGCAITLLRSSDPTDANVRSLVEELKALGFTTFVSGIGGAGVRWHDTFSS